MDNPDAASAIFRYRTIFHRICPEAERFYQLGKILIILPFLFMPVFSYAYGIPSSDGFPSQNERALLTLTNALRHDPPAWCIRCNTSCESANPRIALAYNLNLGRASRFHAQHMHDTPCFQHASCCYLENVDGTVQCSSPPDPSCTGCSSTSCPGTHFSARASLFGGSAMSENIAMGSHGVEQALCQWIRSPGHFNNMISSGGGLGPGMFSGTACYQSYWVQKYGGQGLAANRRIAAGGLIDGSWYAVNYRSQDSTVERAVVVENGLCRDLNLEWGSESEGTWIYPSATGGGSCGSFWFLFIAGDGSRYYYPDEGALGFGGGACPEYHVTRPEADCIECVDGEIEPCYDGPEGTAGIGECRAGTRTCAAGSFGPCEGQVLPSEELCNGRDDNCNGIIDDDCYEEPEDEDPVDDDPVDDDPVDDDPVDDDPVDDDPVDDDPDEDDNGKDPPHNGDSGNGIDTDNFHTYIDGGPVGCATIKDNKSVDNRALGFLLLIFICLFAAGRQRSAGIRTHTG